MELMVEAEALAKRFGGPPSPKPLPPMPTPPSCATDQLDDWSDLFDTTPYCRPLKTDNEPGADRSIT